MKYFIKIVESLVTLNLLNTLQLGLCFAYYVFTQTVFLYLENVILNNIFNYK